MGDRDLSAGIDATELADGRPVAGMVGDEAVVLVRDGGRVCALAGKCTHLQAPLGDGLVVDGELRCPWHHARFDLETGEAVGAPAFAPLARFEVVEERGRVRVGARIAPEADAPVRADPGRPGRPGRIVIVGGGAAGHACAEMLARRGAGAAVTLLSEDHDPPYDRTFCSKQYLAGQKERADAILPPLAGATVRTGTTVTRLLPEERAVVTAAGERIGYDTLVLATGAAVTVPDFYGAERADVFTLRTLADADRLIAAAAGAERALVIGSSYIALEVAASLVQRGLAVTIVAHGDVPLEKTAGPEIGAMVRALHEEKGVTFHMGREVRRWDGRVATLDDGATIAADLVVAGTGVAPRLDLARDAGLAIAGKEAGGGVAVDAALRTSDPRIHAIGDIASVPDPRLGHPIRVEHWVVAQRMGQWLARSILGEVDGGYGDTPFFWSGHYDSNLRYVGHVATPDDRSIDGSVAEKDVAVTFREDGTPQAVLTCGRDLAALEAEAAWDR